MEVKRQRGVEKTSKGRKKGELFGKFLLGKCASATEWKPDLLLAVFTVI